MCLELHWTEYLKAVGPTIIAAIVVYIAYQQWRVNQANLREKLFERRFEVFKDTQEFLIAIIRQATFTDDDPINFQNAPQVARFLFGKKLADYLQEIKSRALDMRLYTDQFQDSDVDGEERNNLVEKKYIELNWLSAQLDVIFDKFEPYLGFKDHK
jgi:hypothetical protein